MENYKEKYEQALETARKINSGEGVAAPKDWSTLEVIFPELRKSENERIKTNIIKLLRFVRDTHHQYFDECNEAIEWFKNHPICDMPKIKFKVGDWVIYKDGTPKSVYQVEKIENYAYTLRHILGGSMPLPFGSQDRFRPWTIRDAKVGDVLEFEDHGRLVIGITSYINRVSNKVDVYCLLEEDKFKVGDFYKLDTINPHPVTVEQCNLFFEKMKGAGYKWDDIKKELIRYEQ